MRKKVGNEDWANYGGRRESEESMSMVHRKAAALAWYKHGRKGTIVLGSGKGKMQNPLSPTLAVRHQGTGQSGTDVSDTNFNDDADEEDPQRDMGNGICVPISQVPCHSLSPVPQASRFKAEALALQSSSSTLPSSSHTTNPNKQQLINMSTGQSLALLSLLPHHQSQKCFNLSKKGCYAGSSSNNGDNNKDNAGAWDCGSSLYDSFELLCLSNQLGRCLTTVNAAAMATSVAPSKLLKNLTSPAMQGPPLQPSYIPRSLYALPQFMIPNYLLKKASKKRSSLIHPVFSMPSSANSSSPSPSLPALPSSPSSHGNKNSSPAEDSKPKKAESGGFRRVFNSLLKSLHTKDDDKPKRSNLSEELEKLPKGRPLGMSRGPHLLQPGTSPLASNRSTPTSPFSSRATAMASEESPTSSSSASKKSPTLSSFSAAAAAAMASKRSLTPNTSPSVQNYYQYHHHFRNEGFRTTSIKPPKSVKWLQPGTS